MRESRLYGGKIKEIKEGRKIKGIYETTDVLYIPNCNVCNEDTNELCDYCGYRFQVNSSDNYMQGVKYCVEIKIDGKKKHYHVCSKNCAEGIIADNGESLSFEKRKTFDRYSSEDDLDEEGE